MRLRFFTKIALLLSCLCAGIKVNAQFTSTNNQTAQQLVDELVGDGVIVLNPVLVCPGVSNAVFKLQTGGSSNLGIDSGIVLSSGNASGAFGAQTTAGPDLNINGVATSTDANLSSLVTQALHDLCKLEFDFVPAGDSIKFDYVFASTEYQNFSCSNFNDVFGFFISGGGFATPYNMAVVPGTSIPITVNSTTGVPTTPGPACTSMGPGSPFSQYYVNNTGGATITFKGFTDIFTAEALVSPCDTYHLKLAIADCSDGALDSGVFLKSGSLSSTALAVRTYGGGGLEIPFTNTVRGCPDGVVRISRSGGNLNQPAVIPLTYEGTAVPGVDYTALPASVTMAPGDTIISLNVHGIPVSPAAGPKSVIINIYSPYTCTTAQPIVLASDTIMIYDSIYVKILNPDTAICIGKHVDLITEADSTLNFVWTPALTVSNPTGQNVTVTPTDPTGYTVAVTLPGVLGTACPASTSSVFVDVKVQPQVSLGPDVVSCGLSVQLNAATTPLNPDETFLWTPATDLNDPTIRNPICTPTATTDYAVTVNPGAVGCDGHDTIRVRLLPDHITVLNNDTVVCAGSQIALRAEGDTAFFYNWAPDPDVVNPTMINTTLNAQTSGYYTLTASYPGCIPMPDSFYVEVQPNPVVSVGPDRVICNYDTVQLYGGALPAYANYAYDWTPGTDLSDSTIQSPVFDGENNVSNLVLRVTTPLGCNGSDSMSITVYKGDFMEVNTNDTGTCQPVSIPLVATGANSYAWTPGYGLSADDIANPIATPNTSTDYRVVGSKYYGSHVCYDTQMVVLKVYPSAVISMPDSVTIWPGESYQIDPQGNCLYFQWFPPSGLTAANISNPVASPEVRTRYFVTASTENGCELKDSIDILVNTETALDVPNAFSPNSGNFKIVKRGIATLSYFRIYNRWGNKVFETSDIDSGWDGTFNGKAQPMGVYIYTIDATSSTGKPFRKNGDLTLIR